MCYNQSTLRSFINADGKLAVCNEPFFTQFGHCTQQLIGRTVTDVFSSFDCLAIVQAVNCCQLHPEQAFTVDMESKIKGGCTCFRWEIYAEQSGGRVTGVHLIGQPMERAA